MTNQELKERQSWSLDKKIDHAVGTIEAFKARTRKPVYVSFSGGKDSTVLLDLARRFIDPNMKGVFCSTGNEYPEIIRFVKSVPNVTIIHPDMTVMQVLLYYGFPLISKEQAQYIREARTTKSEKLRNKRLYGDCNKGSYLSGKISEKWKPLLDAPFCVSEKCCTILKKKPFKKYQKVTGELPILGVMADESEQRRQQYIRRGCNSFSGSHVASYPLSIWTDDDIWAYIRRFNVPYCELYDMGATRTGCMFCGFGAHRETPEMSRFARLKELHPKAYEMFMNYTNNGVTYREALMSIGVALPD